MKLKYYITNLSLNVILTLCCYLDLKKFYDIDPIVHTSSSDKSRDAFRVRGLVLNGKRKPMHVWSDLTESPPTYADDL